MKHKNLNFDLFVYIVINIMSLTLCIDYITYFFDINYIFEFIISSFVLIFVNFVLLKSKKIKINNDIKKEDIIFYLLLLLLFVITIPYPDRSFDTINYHIYLQEVPFGDKIFGDYFAGKNLNSFTYAFPDRLFYLFRYFLGYRLGVIFNYLLLITLYYQVKKVFKYIDSNMPNLIVSIFSTFSVTCLAILDILDSYYIDIISIIILMEIFIQLIYNRIDDNKDYNIMFFPYIGYLFGLAFAIKISNAMLLILFFVIYLIRIKKIYKFLNLKNVILTIICFLLPFIIYMYYTYISTGNPVFPFYNTIFKSEYYNLTNWMDTRFGPTNLKETLFWPIIILFQPNRCVDTAIVEPMWCYGYIVSIIYIVYYFYGYIKYKKINIQKLKYFLVTFLSYVVWSKFQLGYSRYGLIVLVLGAVATFTFVYDIFMKKNNLLIGISIIMILYNYGYTSYHYMYNQEFWIHNNYYNNVDDYGYNISNLFSSGKIEENFEEGSVWGIFYYNAGIAKLVNSEIPIINITSSASNKYTKKLLNDKLESANKIYSLTDSLDFDNFINSLNEQKYIIKNVHKVISYPILANKNEFLYIFEIEKSNNNIENNYTIFENEKVIEMNNNNRIEFWIGLPKDLNKNYLKAFSIEIFESNGIEEKKLGEYKIDLTGSMKRFTYELDEGFDKIIVRTVQNKNDSNWVMLLNVEKEEL